MAGAGRGETPTPAYLCTQGMAVVPSTTGHRQGRAPMCWCHSSLSLLQTSCTLGGKKPPFKAPLPSGQGTSPQGGVLGVTSAWPWTVASSPSTPRVRPPLLVMLGQLHVCHSRGLGPICAAHGPFRSGPKYVEPQLSPSHSKSCGKSGAALTRRSCCTPIPGLCLPAALQLLARAARCSGAMMGRVRA